MIYQSLPLSTPQNVVVVNQPSAPATIGVTVIPRANDYLALTVVMMVICFIHGNLPAFVCLIPALIFANMVSRCVCLHVRACMGEAGLPEKSLSENGHCGLTSVGPWWWWLSFANMVAKWGRRNFLQNPPPECVDVAYRKVVSILSRRLLANRLT